MAEYFDVLDENGAKTGEVKERNAVHRDGDWHAAVNIFVLNQKNEMLLQKRAANKDSYPNMWDLSCGGHVVTGEDYEISALRELSEELGIAVKTGDLEQIGEFKTRSQPKPDFINNSIERVYLLRGDWQIKDMKLQKEEVANICYVPWRELRAMLVEPHPDDILRHRKQYEALFDVLEKAESTRESSSTAILAKRGYKRLNNFD